VFKVNICVIWIEREREENPKRMGPASPNNKKSTMPFDILLQCLFDSFKYMLPLYFRRLMIQAKDEDREST
jgi:hypothetical protein